MYTFMLSEDNIKHQWINDVLYKSGTAKFGFSREEGSRGSCTFLSSNVGLLGGLAEVLSWVLQIVGI